MIYLIVDDDYSSFTFHGCSRDCEKILALLNKQARPKDLSIYAMEEENETGEYLDIPLEPATWTLTHIKGSQQKVLAEKLSAEECARQMAEWAEAFKYKCVHEGHYRGSSTVWASNLDNVNLRQYFDGKVHEMLSMTPAEMKYVTPDEPRAGDAGSTIQS